MALFYGLLATAAAAGVTVIHANDIHARYARLPAAAAAARGRPCTFGWCRCLTPA